MTINPMKAAEQAAAEVCRIVAKAMFDAQAEDGEDFDALSADDQASFTILAGSAITGYRAHLHEHGYKITPPDAFVAPTSEQEARAMLSVASGYLQKPKSKGGLLATPGLIIPGRMQ